MKNQIKTILIISVVFFLVIAFIWTVLTLIVVGSEYKTINRFVLNIDEDGSASSETASVLFYHNNQPLENQSGIEIISHGERIATNGNLCIWPDTTEKLIYPQILNKIADDSANHLKVELYFEDYDLACFAEITLLENSFRLAIHTDRPLPESLNGKLLFTMEFYPPAYVNNFFYMDGEPGVFSTTVVGKAGLKNLFIDPIAEGTNLILAPENPLKKIKIQQEKGNIRLVDGRLLGQGHWIMVNSEIPQAVTNNAMVWEVNIHQVKGWKRKPVILHSQIGYHPDQRKEFLLELPGYERYVEEAELLKLDVDGKWTRIRSNKPVYKGPFQRYFYYGFDISNVKENGLYRVQFNDQSTRTFRISENIYNQNIWRPTLETFFPVQMDHMEVRDRGRIRHGRCGRDDAVEALQAKIQSDGFEMGDTAWSNYESFKHIPGLNVEGWIRPCFTYNTLSQINTVYWLGLAYRIFAPETDNTTVDLKKRIVRLHEPDGVPDIVQQIEYGAVYLLNGYKNIGHASQGGRVSGRQPDRYPGDEVNQTDNLIYNSSLDSTEMMGKYPRIHDDLMAFSDSSNTLVYGSIKSLVLSSLVLDPYNPVMADYCLQTAIRVWNKIQDKEADLFHTEITHSGLSEIEKINAAVELFLATGKDKYKDEINNLLPVIKDHFPETAASVSRIYHGMDTRFRELYRITAENYLDSAFEEVDKNPFRVPLGPEKWGNSQDILEFGANLYLLYQIFPDLIDPEYIYQTLHYVLGLHPCSNVSLVSGIGRHSMLTGYSINCADYSCIPGGVIYGPALIQPDFPELKENRPFIQSQSTYGIEGSAAYIFCVLAVEDLLQ